MKAIVYTSNTGHTADYAKLLSEQTGLPAYSLEEAKAALGKEDGILYLGWLMASHVVGYKVCARRYRIEAVCGVGLCETGCLLKEARKATGIPAAIPLFTLQGGMDRDKLTGIHRKMIDTLTAFMEKKKNPTEEDRQMTALLKSGGYYVSEDNLTAVLDWWETQKKKE